MATTATTPSELITVITSTIRSQTAPNSITPITHSDLLDNIVQVLSASTSTTGATLVGETVYFDRVDALSAFTLNLSSIGASDYLPLSGGTMTGTIDMSGSTIQLSNISGDIQSISATDGNIVFNSDAYLVDIATDGGLLVRNGINSNSRIALGSGATGIAFGEGSGGVLNSLTTSSIKTWNLPDVSGTIALLSNIVFTGGTVTGATNFTSSLTANTLNIQSVTTGTSVGTLGIDSNGNVIKLQYTEVPISAAELRNSFTSPKQILPTLAAGSYYSDVKFVVEFSAGSVGFDTGDKTMYIFTISSYIPLMSIDNQPFLWATNKNLVAESVSTMYYNPLTPDVSSGIQNTTTPEAIVLGTWSSNSTIGNGTMLVKIWYNVKTFGTEL